MQTAFLAIQCKPFRDETKLRGTFLYTGDMIPVSPVFAEGCIPCFDWAAANGWTQSAYDRAHPCGVYVRAT